MNPAISVVIALATEHPDKWVHAGEGHYYTVEGFDPRIFIRLNSRFPEVEFKGGSWYDTDTVELGLIEEVRLWWALRGVRRHYKASQQAKKLKSIREKLNGLPHYRYPFGDDAEA